MNRRTLYPLWIWILWVLLVPLALMALALIAFTTIDVNTLLFDHPHWWWLTAAGPLVGLVVLYGVARRRQALDRFASPQLAPLLAAQVSPARSALRSSLVTVAVLMIVAGVIGPRWGLYPQKHKVRGVDIVVALDVSRSMLARDVPPNRLERAKREARQQLIERSVFQHANRLALLAFAGSTSLRLPLTTDHLAFRSKLKTIHVGSAPRGGTALAEAIHKATDLFATSPPEATKMILLFTDGEDHEGDPVEAARTALRDHGIHTFTVGVGDPARTVGVPIPTQSGGKALLYDGQIVFSKLDEAGLRKIATAGGGKYAAIKDFHNLVDAMAGMKKTELTMEERIRHKPRYQWFIATALILLGLEMLMSDRREAVANRPQRVWQQEFV